VTGAMLMLNTDLHIADLSKHMSRAEFVKNSMRAVQESMPVGSAGSNMVDFANDDIGNTAQSASDPATSSAASSVRSRPPRDAVPAVRSASAPVTSQLHSPSLSQRGESSTSIGTFSYTKAWEQEAENALRVRFSTRIR
jgi:PH/SEC7 domain-containing protein